MCGTDIDKTDSYLITIKVSIVRGSDDGVEPECEALHYACSMPHGRLPCQGRLTIEDNIVTVPHEPLDQVTR